MHDGCVAEATPPSSVRPYRPESVIRGAIRADRYEGRTALGAIDERRRPPAAFGTVVEWRLALSWRTPEGSDTALAV